MRYHSWKRLADMADGRCHWELRDQNERVRAEVWGGVWHTYSESGTGGENDIESDHEQARVAAWKALVRQGWAEVTTTPLTPFDRERARELCESITPAVNDLETLARCLLRQALAALEDAERERDALIRATWCLPPDEEISDEARRTAVAEIQRQVLVDAKARREAAPRRQVTPEAAAQTREASDICPECCRTKARNIGDVLAGFCPKWWAIRDPEAENDCKRVAAILTAKGGA